MSDALLRRLAAAIFFVTLTLLALHQLHAYDIWWQIAAGDWIASNGWPQSDPFSYGFPGGEWIEPRWLFCLAVAFLYKSFGASALILFKIALLIGTFVVLAAGVRAKSIGALLAGGSLSLLTMQERFVVRPELVSFLALAIVLLVWERSRDSGANRWPYLLLPLQLIWCNSHTLWILGPVSWLILLVGESIQNRKIIKRDFVIALLLPLVALLNPWTIEGALNPLRLFMQLGDQHSLGQTIHEFQSPFSATFFDFNLRTFAYLMTIALSALSWWRNREKLSIGSLLLWGAFLFLSFRAQRNVALFGLVAGWVTALNLDRCCDGGDRRRFERPIIATLLLGLTGWALLVVSGSFYEPLGSTKRFGLGLSDRYPLQAVQVARRDAPDARIFHTLGDGGYVLYEGGDGSAYVDGRLEVYDPDELQLALAATTDGDVLQRELSRSGATRVLVALKPAHQPMLEELERDAGWSPIFHSSWHVLYARRDRIPATVQLIDWNTTQLQAPDAAGDLRLGALYIAVDAWAAAEAAYRRVLERAPSNRLARGYLALIEYARGESTTITRDDLEAHLVVARAARAAGNGSVAIDSYRRAIELGAATPTTEFSLVRLLLTEARYAEADALLDELATDHPENVERINLAAISAIRQLRPKQAIPLLMESLALEPNQPTIRGMLQALRAAHPLQ